MISDAEGASTAHCAGPGRIESMTPGLWRSLGDRAQVWPGRNWPLGATWTAESTNFAVYAPDATEVWLCLFDDEDESGGERRFPLTEHSLGIWHGALPDIAPGHPYGYRVHGPWDPGNGMRFNPQQLLLDPYGLAVSGTTKAGTEILAYDVDDPTQPSSIDSATATARSIVVDPSFDWEGDPLPKHRWRDTVIYELHVKGFTQLHDRIPEELRGTYAGLGHPVVTDYLADLGVTAVELLPVHQFFSEPALLERGLTNYWGYNSIGFFAPHADYSASGDRGQQVAEFKQMVKSLHRAGLEVILDVVYNHTAEAGRPGCLAVLPWPRRPRLLPTGARRRGRRRRRHVRRHLLGRHGLRQHRQLRGSAGAAADPRLAALLGDRDARRRLPVRPDVRAHPHRPRHRHVVQAAHRDGPGPGAPARQADRRAVGRLHGRLPGRPDAAALGGVERPVPRHDPRLLARPHQRDARGRHPAGRLVGPLRRRRAVGVQLGQLRHRPRRVHGARPGLLRQQAQRGQRRGQPRRHRQQPVVEPRGRR